MKKSSKPGPKPKLKDPRDFGRPFLSVDEFAQCINFSRAEAYKFIKHNPIPIQRNGSRYLIHVAVVEMIQNGSYYTGALGGHRTESVMPPQFMDAS